MNVREKTSSRDEAIANVFGGPIDELYAQATNGTASKALERALELRSFLAMAEEQVVQVRERVHKATAADRDPGALSADDLRWEATWLEAAQAGRDSYVAALDELLRTMPAPGPRASRVRHGPLRATAAPPSAAARTAAARTRRP